MASTLIAHCGGTYRTRGELAGIATPAGTDTWKPVPHFDLVSSLIDDLGTRGIAVTRKNFLFLGSQAGGERAATLYTVLETAKLNGLDPEAYLATVLDRMARGHASNRLAELLPWNIQPDLAAAA